MGLLDRHQLGSGFESSPEPLVERDNGSVGLGFREIASLRLEIPLVLPHSHPLVLHKELGHVVVEVLVGFGFPIDRFGDGFWSLQVPLSQFVAYRHESLEPLLGGDPHVNGVRVAV